VARPASSRSKTTAVGATVAPAGWSLLTSASGWALHRSPLAAVGMLVLQFVGLIFLQRYQVHVQAQCQRSVLKLVRIMPGVTAVQTHADGSFEIRSDHADSPRSGNL
jgi:hypothetical protein